MDIPGCSGGLQTAGVLWGLRAHDTSSIRTRDGENMDGPGIVSGYVNKQTNKQLPYTIIPQVMKQTCPSARSPAGVMRTAAITRTQGSSVCTPT